MFSDMSSYSINFNVFIRQSSDYSLSYKVSIGSPWPFTGDCRPFVSTIKNKLDSMRISHRNGIDIEKVEFISQTEYN